MPDSGVAGRIRHHQIRRRSLWEAIEYKWFQK